MNDYCSDFKGKNEMEAVRMACYELAPQMCDTVLEAVAKADMQLSHEPLSEQQKHFERSRRAHLYLSEIWSQRELSPTWDRQEYPFLRLTHFPTKLDLRYRAADPITHKSPAASRTFSSRARYTQSLGLSADQLTFNTLGVPILAGINVVLACDYSKLDTDTFLWVYKPLTPGMYGINNPTAYSFPIRMDSGRHVLAPDLVFTPDEGNDTDLIDLLSESKQKISA